ncbi:MAG: 23S rRNA (uracil(1939)-C(5))-methyltransferase RlmD [Tenericutes bacterium]|nr:23S rRNA (uracil(1939)-C(5))-methyltransferase RlmD [Mycoplasmatota bacterium]
MKLVIGDQIKLDIRKQGINGEGVGYYNKTLVFVPGAIVKEKVACEVTFVADKYAIGRIVKIMRTSTKRMDPPCKYYEDCGSCHMQHIEYKEQLKIKQSIIKQSFKRYTDYNVEELDIKKTIGMDDPYKYRNKSQMPFRNTKFGLAVGFYKPESNHFVQIEECIVHHKQINRINSRVVKLLNDNGYKANDSANPDGILVFLVTRYLEKTNSASVTIIVREYKEDLKKIGREIISTISNVKSVTYSVNNPKSNLVISDRLYLLAGEMWIEDEFQDLKVKISPDAFHQLNTVQMEKMYEKIIDMADIGPDSIVFDLYSGIGITSILLSKVAKKVYGIDYSEASIKDAIENARLNNIENVEFIAEHVESAMPKLINKGIKPNVVLLDPPRSGLAPLVIAALAKTLPKQIVYVSCNPSTLAKDISKLGNKYKIKSITPIDMFPNTASVESITLLELN